MTHAEEAQGAGGADWVESDLHVAFGMSVRLRRAVLGISQEGLGQASGVHRNYVGAIERAEINPTLFTISRITAGLGIPLAALLEQAERMAADPATIATIRAKRTGRRRSGEAIAARSK